MPGSTARRILAAACRRSSRKRGRSASSSSRDGGRSGRSSMPRGTARSRGCSDRPSGSRITTPELREKAAVYINTDGNGRGFLNVGGSHALEALRQRRRARHRGSRDEAAGLEAHAGARASTSTAPGPTRGGSRPRRPADRRARLGLRLHAVPPARRHPVAESRRSAGSKNPTGSITRSTTTTTTSRSSSTPTSPTAARWRRRSARPSSGSPTPTCCRSSSRTSPTPSQTYVRELQALLKERAGRGPRAQPADRGRRVRRASPIAAAARQRRRSRRCRRRLNFAPLENAAAALTRAADRYRKALDAARAKITPEAARAPSTCD